MSIRAIEDCTNFFDCEEFALRNVHSTKPATEEDRGDDILDITSPHAIVFVVWVFRRKLGKLGDTLSLFLDSSFSRRESRLDC